MSKAESGTVIDPQRRTVIDVALSAWMVPVLLGAAWGPFLLTDLLLPASSPNRMAFGMAWVFPAMLFNIGAVLSAIVQIVKLLLRLFQSGRQ